MIPVGSSLPWGTMPTALRGHASHHAELGPSTRRGSRCSHAAALTTRCHSHAHAKPWAWHPALPVPGTTSTHFMDFLCLTIVPAGMVCLQNVTAEQSYHDTPQNLQALQQS